MTTDAFDPNEFKASQRRDWSAAAAGWRKWWPTIERAGQRVTDRLVELAGLRPGDRVLDVATGIGEPAITAARRVGSTGYVIGTDLSPGMLAVAREREASIGLPNVEFLEMDAEALDLPDGSVNAVLCRWGLMFLPNLTDALTAMHRVLTPGGRLAVAVWEKPAEDSLMEATLRAAREILRLPSPPPGGGAPNPFSLAGDALERMISEVEFSILCVERMPVVFELPTPEAYTSYLREVSSTVRGMLAGRSEAQQTAVWSAIEAAARHRAAADGSVRLEYLARLVAATKRGSAGAREAGRVTAGSGD